jgi:hypothetical protein
MQYYGLAWFAGLLALLVLLIGARILLRPNWVLGWLRGTCGLAFVGLAALLALLAVDLASYRVIPENRPLATITFKADGLQRYQVVLFEGAQERSLTLDGDMWQLDARVLQWKGLAELIGLRPVYRLQKISGRYLSIEQQQKALDARVALYRSHFDIDLWSWLRMGGGHDLFTFDAQAHRVSYLPMADGAAFALTLAPTGLLAKPLNFAAEQALRSWE